MAKFENTFRNGGYEYRMQWGKIINIPIYIEDMVNKKVYYRDLKKTTRRELLEAFNRDFKETWGV